MRTWVRAALATLALWSLAGPSVAGTLEISFSLDRGMILFRVPGESARQASTITGSGRVVLTGVNGLGFLTGPSASGSLADLRISFPGSVQPDGGVAMFRLAQEGTATGSFDGFHLRIPALALSARLTRSNGETILLANSQLTELMLFFPFQGPFAWPSIGVTLWGRDGSTAVGLRVDGQEVARRFSAPEGQIGEYLTFGLIGLVGMATWRRRPRGSSDSGRLTDE